MNINVSEVGKATVQYFKVIDNFEDAAKAAKELSFSLADSFMPGLKQNFEKFCFMEFKAYCLEWNDNPDSEKWAYTFPENEINGDPFCVVRSKRPSESGYEIDGDDYQDIFQYETTGGTSFHWFEKSKICVVQMCTDNLSESSGYDKAILDGWQPKIVSSEPLFVHNNTTSFVANGFVPVYEDGVEVVEVFDCD